MFLTVKETQSQRKVFYHQQWSLKSLKFKSQGQEKLVLIGTKFQQIDYNLHKDYILNEAQILKIKINEQEQQLKKIRKKYAQATDKLDNIRSQYAPQNQKLEQQIYENNKKKTTLQKNKKDLIEKNQEKPSNDAQFQIQQLQAEIDYISKITARKQHWLSSNQSDIRIYQENKQRLRRNIISTRETIQNYRKQSLIMQGIKISKYNH